MDEYDVALDFILLHVLSHPLHTYPIHFQTSAVPRSPIYDFDPDRTSSALVSLLPFFSRNQSYSVLSTSVLSQSQPPPNIPAYHVALDGFVLRSIGVECLPKHSRIEEAIYNCGRKPRISQNETYGRGFVGRTKW